MEQRRCVVLQGDDVWQKSICPRLLSRFNSDNIIEIAGSQNAVYSDASLTYSQAKSLIGQEYDVVIFHLAGDVSADSLGIVVGTIRAGGVLVLCLQEVQAAGRWLQRFMTLTQSYVSSGPVFYCLNPSDPIPALSPPSHVEMTTTAEQLEAIKAVQKVVTGHRRRPLVITADRGRGKSAALGMAAAELLRQGKSQIIVTAPSLSAAKMVFEHAARVLCDAEVSTSKIVYQGKTIVFMAPDALLASNCDADLVIVDEAAAIPSAILSTLLSRYSRLVFASTLHGYEGTGRGFAVRFYGELERQTPDWQHCKLTSPIRWRRDDVLEKWSFDVLLLDADPVNHEQVLSASITDAYCERLSAEQLLNDESLLRHVFGLMVLAHYRTRPSDLQILLDQPGMQIDVLRIDGMVIGCAWSVSEGELAADLSQAVYRGERRISGHLLPQSLLAHTGLPHAGQYRYQRIIRLAIHPSIQRQGLGLRLVKAMLEKWTDRDLVGVSFAADSAMLTFWQQCGFKLVRLGVQRDEVSGAYAAIMLQARSDDGDNLLVQACTAFGEQWDDLVAMQFKTLSPTLVTSISQSLTQQPIRITKRERGDITRFAQAKAGYAFCQTSIRHYVRQAVRQAIWLQLDDATQSLLVQRVLQGKTIPDVVATLSLTGKAQLDNHLRQAIAQLILLTSE